MRKLFEQTQAVLHKKLKIFTFLMVLGLSLIQSNMAYADDNGIDLVDMPLDELINMNVTSVSKKPQKLSDAAAAIFVITSEDIRRSGATSVPEVLRIVPGLNVAQIDANKWAVSARGFNDLFANHLLVLVDGRTVYTPMFSGIFWDSLDVFLPDVERIEVIRGPGATLWGSNAVNGVINIITKSAEDTQGGLVYGGGGNQVQGLGGARYGGKLSDDTYYRLYSKYTDQGPSAKLGAPGDANDNMQQSTTGFRIDSQADADNYLTVQGDLTYEERRLDFMAPSLSPPYSEEIVGNTSNVATDILARWTRTFENSGELQTQAYYDYTNRNDLVVEHSLDTYDFDTQYLFPKIGRHELIVGGGYRYYQDHFDNTDTVTFEPDSRNFDIFTYFAQDQIEIVPETVSLILGSKFEHTEFAGFDFLPSARVLWTPDEKQTVWGAISKGSRTPSRAKTDINLQVAGFPTPTGLPGIAEVEGQGNFENEDLIAYELGYRVQALKNLSFDLATFYNHYNNLASLEPQSPVLSPDGSYVEFPLLFDNGLNGDTYGAELATNWLPYSWWNLEFTYAYLNIEMSQDSSSNDSRVNNAEGESPDSQFGIRSLVNLPYDMEFDAFYRFVDSLPELGISSYAQLDLRLGWNYSEKLEFSIVGQNLLDDDHQEFKPVNFVTTESVEIQRGVYGMVTWKF